MNQTVKSPSTEDRFDPQESLRRNVSLLGSLLGETMAEHRGDEFLARVEEIRLLSKAASGGDESAWTRLETLLMGLSDTEIIPVARAFAQFLNLANIAEQHHGLSREMDRLNSSSRTLTKVIERLVAEGLDADAIFQAVSDLRIELVLTAHPTEITRRSLIHKHEEIERCLHQLESTELTDYEYTRVDRRLRELIAQLWHTDEFRAERPTPVDEARGGFAVVENSLWRAVPEFLRRLDEALEVATGRRLPLDAAPVLFSSWMGGDRDGNPYVTAAVTRRALLLGRWQAASLYIVAVDQLVQELSMIEATEALRTAAQHHREPYRAVLGALRERLRRWRDALADSLAGRPVVIEDLIDDIDVLRQPLTLCFESLRACGMARIAEGRLLDLLRHISCFGLNLVRMDLRQHSERHTQALTEITETLGLGRYEDWSEEQRRAWLCEELSSRRPLIPLAWTPSAEVQEVLDCCATAVSQPDGALACYIISMARQASDVLAVRLLLRISGGGDELPVVPLFETLDDLDRAPSVIEDLLTLDVTRGTLRARQMVMIGYSDSAKDAGILAAAWAQYRAQEALLQICNDAGVGLQLFHGRGGTIGRGGAPAHDALLSQPPGSLENGFRVTEQGEMIRVKLGMTGLAVKTLAVYTSAILEARILRPPEPAPTWRATMDRLAQRSCDAYRRVVRETPEFLDYFRQATPEGELAILPLASRPTSRKQGGGIESLRAIPWIFSWMQNRLMLPSWLGAGEALRAEVDGFGEATLLEMARVWPFFATRLSMLDMVFSKTDRRISAFYERRLAEESLWPLGEELRRLLASDRETVRVLLDASELLGPAAWTMRSLDLRNIYVGPLNVLQAELLTRVRREPGEATRQALMITIAGVAAGMRNTG